MIRWLLQVKSAVDRAADLEQDEERRQLFSDLRASGAERRPSDTADNEPEAEGSSIVGGGAAAEADAPDGGIEWLLSLPPVVRRAMGLISVGNRLRQKCC